MGVHEEEFGCYSSWWCVLIIKSNIGLCVSAKVSFVCCFCLLRYMYTRSSLFSYWPFISMWGISNMSLL
jgi:hypothetical protein